LLVFFSFFLVGLHVHVLDKAIRELDKASASNMHKYAFQATIGASVCLLLSNTCCFLFRV
jgi:hypothetical protein